MLQFASVDDVYPAQPTAPETREHRRRKGKRDAPEGEEQPTKMEPIVSVATAPRPPSVSMSSLNPELMRMAPYIAAAVLVVIIGLLFDIRNTLKHISDALTRSSARYLRY